MQHQKETNLVLTLKEESMIRNDKQIFNPLKGKEQDSIIGGCTPIYEEASDEKTFFETHGIYQI